MGGLASEAQGGEFRHGFYSSAASTGIMHISGVREFMGGDNGGWWGAARVATAATIGGTVSVVGGGKFANGAVTSAFQQMFNAEAQHWLARTEFKPKIAFYDSKDPNMRAAAERYAGAENAFGVSSADGIRVHFELDDKEGVYDEIALFTHSGSEITIGFAPNEGHYLNKVAGDDPIWGTIVSGHLKPAS